MHSPKEEDNNEYDFDKESVLLDKEITKLTIAISKNNFIDDDEVKALEDRIEMGTTKIQEMKEKSQKFKSTKTQEDNEIIQTKIKMLLKNLLELNQKYNNTKRERELRMTKIQHMKVNEDGTTYVDISDEKAEELLELQKMKDEGLFDQAKEKYREILENRIDIQRIERSMLELQILQCDLGSLINEQKEVIDTTLVNAQEANKKVESGNKNLKQAAEYDKAACGKNKCLCIILLIILALVGSIVLATQLN
jgi:t-SNARE complex subunit (syntaxin)